MGRPARAAGAGADVGGRRGQGYVCVVRGGGLRGGRGGAEEGGEGLAGL